MAKKGHKSMRKTPEMYDEIKKNFSFGLTPTAVANLDALAQQLGISRSEIVERFARKTLQIPEESPPFD